MNQFLKNLFAPDMPDDIGNSHVEWQFPEFAKEERSRAWYIAAAVILGLLLLFAVYTANFLFAIILLLSVFVIVYQFFQAPRNVPVVIGEDGIIVDKRFYPYKELKSFWIIYEPPHSKYLYLDFKSQIKKSLPVPLEDANPLAVREALLNYLIENLEEEDEHLGETLSRVLKIR